MDFYELKTWQKAKLFDQIMENNFGEDFKPETITYDSRFGLELEVEEYFDDHIQLGKAKMCLDTAQLKREIVKCIRDKKTY